MKKNYIVEDYDASKFKCEYLRDTLFVQMQMIEKLHSEVKSKAYKDRFDRIQNILSKAYCDTMRELQDLMAM